jgi:hypothetical protein
VSESRLYRIARWASFVTIRVARYRWDIIGKKPNDPVERFSVPLLAKSLIALNWCSPLGSAIKART